MHKFKDDFAKSKICAKKYFIKLNRYKKRYITKTDKNQLYNVKGAVMRKTLTIYYTSTCLKEGRR